jgi:hypothetical protein
MIYDRRLFFVQVSGISNEIFRQIETVENRYDQSTAEAFRSVQKSGEMVVRKLDPRQFIRLASETAPKINVNTNVSMFKIQDSFTERPRADFVLAFMELFEEHLIKKT